METKTKEWGKANQMNLMSFRSSTAVKEISPQKNRYDVQWNYALYCLLYCLFNASSTYLLQINAEVHMAEKVPKSTWKFQEIFTELAERRPQRFPWSRPIKAKRERTLPALTPSVTLHGYLVGASDAVDRNDEVQNLVQKKLTPERFGALFAMSFGAAGISIFSCDRKKKARPLVQWVCRRCCWSSDTYSWSI